MPEINASLTIRSGYNQFDPVADLISQAAQPEATDPTMAARLQITLTEVVTLCERFGDAKQITEHRTLLQTPPTTYVDSRTGRQGTVWLTALKDRAADGTARHEAGLWCATSRSIGRLLFELSDEVLLCHTPVGVHAGDNGHLNYFRGIADKIRTAAYPVSRSRV